MRRGVSFALALGLAAVVVLAAIDALRRPPRTQAPPVDEEPPSAAIWMDSGEAIAARLARLGVTGTLYLSPDGCGLRTTRPLRAVRLPDLGLSDGPGLGSCPFSLSVDGGYAAGPEAVWSPKAPIFAAGTGTALAVIDAERAEQWELAGSTPAFKPNGTFTSVLDGSIVVWTSDCPATANLTVPQFPFAPDETRPYCAREVVGQDELARLLPAQASVTAVERLVWTSDDRAVALLQTSAGPRLASFEGGRNRASAARPAGDQVGPMRARPGGGEIAVLAGGHVSVYGGGHESWRSPVDARAFDWSPDGDWLAYATTFGVYLVRASDWTSQFRLPASTHGLAWRRDTEPAAPRQ